MLLYHAPCNQTFRIFYLLYGEKDGAGPVMVSDTLCPALHILGGLLFVQSRAADLREEQGRISVPPWGAGAL